MITDSTTSTGIMNFDTRSMPFSTPAKIIVSVSAASCAAELESSLSKLSLFGISRGFSARRCKFCTVSIRSET